MNRTCNIKTCSRKPCLENEECVEKSYARLVKEQQKQFLRTLENPFIPKEKLSKKEKEVYRKTDGKCWICDELIRIEDFTKDHVIPKSKGGSSKLENLLPAHKLCNNIKSDTVITDKKQLEEIRKIIKKHLKSKQSKRL